MTRELQTDRVSSLKVLKAESVENRILKDKKPPLLFCMPARVQNVKSMTSHKHKLRSSGVALITHSAKKSPAAAGRGRIRLAL